MKPICILLGLFASVAVAFSDELKSNSGWRLDDETTGPFRHAIVVTSPDGVAQYEAEFIMINNGAEFIAELKRDQQLLGQFRCSYVAAGYGAHFNVYDPPNKGLDASGRYQFPDEDGDEEISLAEAKAEYEKQDRVINEVYKALMARLTDALKTDLRDRQRGWIEHKEYIAGFQARAPEGEEKQSPLYWETAAYMTQDRAGFLRHVYANEEISESVSGTYIDEHGGTLSILERGDDWVFAIDVVRGPTFHLGFIRGAAKKTDGGAHFKDLNSENFIEGKPAQITLKRSGSRILIEGEDTQYYHGMRAYFDGEFFKVTDLIQAYPDVDY